MIKTSSPLVLALTLISVAGWVDAIGYLQFGHLFVSFMSGNSTQLAVGLGKSDWIGSLHIGIIIACFVFGAFAGALVTFAAGRWRLPALLVCEASLLLIALFWPVSPGIFSVAAIPIAVAMGLQNAALHRVGQRTVGLTYITGMLVRCGQELAEAIAGRGERWAWLGDLGMWLAMICGAVIGGVSFIWLGLQAVVIPAGIAIVLAIVGARAASLGVVPE